MIYSIVLTGGPCGGKSSALPVLRQAIEDCGVRVITVPETATELMQSGVTPDNVRDRSMFQVLNIRYMTAKHDLAFDAAECLPDDRDTVIIFDRGINDCMAYCGRERLEERLSLIGRTPIVSRDRYGAVFHLTTAASGASDNYNTENNSVRTETPDEAVRLDSATLAAWIGHPHLRVIGNDGSFEDKVNRLIAEVKAFLGIPAPLETERKFLIKYPDIDQLDNDPMCQKVDITQVYLRMPDGSKCRIRKRGIGSDCVYIKTEKHTISSAVREEEEQRITREEYERLLEFADPDCRPIEKTRRLIVSGGKYFELDTFGFWKDRALLEIELLSENEQFILPEFVEVIREVTDDRRYNNYHLAQSIPFE